MTPSWPRQENIEWIDALREGRRERIATAALQGILANPKENLTGLDIQWHAQEAVRYADALIAELGKEKT